MYVCERERVRACMCQCEGERERERERERGEARKNELKVRFLKGRKTSLRASVCPAAWRIPSGLLLLSRAPEIRKTMPASAC
jgi:hypothetical protein